MKSRHLISAVGITIGICLCACSHSFNQNEPSPSNQPGIAASESVSPTKSPAPAKPLQAEQIEKTWPSKFTFDVQTISRKHEGLRGYSISADCRLIKNASTRTTQNFNRWMLRKIRGYVRQFESLERAAEIHDKRKRLKKVDINESLEILSQVYYSDDRLISLRLSHIVFALGQMHPIDYYETINYDLKKERDLWPAEVFKRGYLNLFSDYVRAELKNKYDFEDEWAKEWLERGTTPNKSNFKDWNVVPDGILISFEDYQIAPHAFGQAEMIIPFPKLKRKIRSDSVIGRFLKS